MGTNMPKASHDGLSSRIVSGEETVLMQAERIASFSWQIGGK
jgi:hypothetical protein